MSRGPSSSPPNTLNRSPRRIAVLILAGKVEPSGEVVHRSSTPHRRDQRPTRQAHSDNGPEANAFEDLLDEQCRRTYRYTSGDGQRRYEGCNAGGQQRRSCSAENRRQLASQAIGEAARRSISPVARRESTSDWASTAGRQLTTSDMSSLLSWSLSDERASENEVARGRRASRAKASGRPFVWVRRRRGAGKLKLR